MSTFEVGRVFDVQTRIGDVELLAAKHPDVAPYVVAVLAPGIELFLQAFDTNACTRVDHKRLRSHVKRRGKTKARRPINIARTK